MVESNIYYCQVSKLGDYTQESFDSQLPLHTLRDPTRKEIADHLRNTLGEPHSIIHFFRDPLPDGDGKPELFTYVEGDSSSAPRHGGRIHVLVVSGALEEKEETLAKWALGVSIVGILATSGVAIGAYFR